MLPHRCWAFAGVVLLFTVTAGFMIAGCLYWVCAAISDLSVVPGMYDVMQMRHPILRNHPLWGHSHLLFELIRPEIRQRFVEGDADEKPPSHAQHSIVYQHTKGGVDSRPFGTEVDVKAAGHEWIGYSLAPTRIASSDFHMMMNEGHAKLHSVSVFNISTMSLGALSGSAIRALNRGVKFSSFIRDTGEGLVLPYCCAGGGNPVREVALGYFGCRGANNRFDPDRFAEQARSPWMKMIGVKLSQGAKPGHGGTLPAAKVTPETAAMRGIQIGKDCISSAAHSGFSMPLGLLQSVGRLRTLSSDKPTGFRLCTGYPQEFLSIVRAVLDSGILPDLIIADGAEGGTDAASLEFTNHAGAPLRKGLLLVHNTLVGISLRDRTKVSASGKIVTTFDIARTLATGADWYDVARGFVPTLDYIQAQRCHTDHCPTSMAT